MKPIVGQTMFGLSIKEGISSIINGQGSDAMQKEMGVNSMQCVV